MKINLETTAFVFPGQGSQAVGMGKELAEQFPIAKQVFDEADVLFDFNQGRHGEIGPGHLGLSGPSIFLEK